MAELSWVLKLQKIYQKVQNESVWGRMHPAMPAGGWCCLQRDFGYHDLLYLCSVQKVVNSWSARCLPKPLSPFTKSLPHHLSAQHLYYEGYTQHYSKIRFLQHMAKQMHIFTASSPQPHPLLPL